MKYSPELHHRRSIRLRGYDYSQPGAYFVTVCTHNGGLLLESQAAQEAVLAAWQGLPMRFPAVALDEFVIMPNHVHGIICVVGARHASPLQGSADPTRPRGAVAGSLSAIVGSFKAAAAKRINAIRKTHGSPVWQRNYYERVIRDEEELGRVRQYIRDNPLRWDEDPENSSNL
jgi:putative transposase